MRLIDEGSECNFLDNQRGVSSCRNGSAYPLPLRPVAALGQEQESGSTSGEARSGGGLGEMTHRKREIIGLRNEQDFPHLVELALPP
jgi:hypothetical protein